MNEADFAKYIDHTLLKPDAIEADIMRLCSEAKKYHFAAVCVQPCWVETAVQELSQSDIKVCTVIGFPLGSNLTEIKVEEAKQALANGAEEIDMVINIGRAKMQDSHYLYQEIKSVAAEVKNKQGSLKIILETALLSEAEKKIVAEAALSAGADYLKTSTGFAAGGATKEDVALLRKLAGKTAGVKAAGGIRNLKDMLTMIEAGASRIGTSAGIALLEEFRKEE